MLGFGGLWTVDRGKAWQFMQHSRDFSHTADAVDHVREFGIALVRIELAKSERDIAER